MGQPLTTLLILGSGMSSMLNRDEIEIEVEEESGVEGHRGAIALWKRGGEEVMIALGRRHLYEGWSMGDVAAIVHRARERGARRMIVTNAAGGLNPLLRVGDLMLIDDILPMPGFSFGSTISDRSGMRLPELFDRGLCDEVEERCIRVGVALSRGVYAMVSGPSYETRAEVRMLRRIGADAVGMSTLPEVLAARGWGMRSLGVSLITNIATGVSSHSVSHSDVLDVAARSVSTLRTVVEAALATAGSLPSGNPSRN